jgi:hypothetical protein
MSFVVHVDHDLTVLNGDGSVVATPRKDETATLESVYDVDYLADSEAARPADQATQRALEQFRAMSQAEQDAAAPPGPIGVLCETGNLPMKPPRRPAKKKAKKKASRR